MGADLNSIKLVLQYSPPDLQVGFKYSRFTPLADERENNQTMEALLEREFFLLSTGRIFLFPP